MMMIISDDGLYGYYGYWHLFKFHMLYIQLCDLCTFGSDSDFSDMYCECREGGFTLVCYDSMYSGLLVTLAME